MRIKELSADIRDSNVQQEMLLTNNCAVVILINDHNPLEDSTIAAILDNISWIDEADSDNEWAVFSGDKDVHLIRIKDGYTSRMLADTICLAESIYIVDPDCMSEDVSKTASLLLEYQDMVIKEALQDAIDEPSKKSEEEKELEQYQDELFTTISKRRHKVLDKCFNIFAVTQTPTTTNIKQIN